MTEILGKKVGDIGFGLMSLTTRGDKVLQDQAFAAMRAALASGATLWDGGDFYGTPQYNSLHLLRAYFDAHPADEAKVLVSIKGGMDSATMKPTNDAASVRASVENALAVLKIDRLDIYEQARQDTTTPVEEAMGALQALVDEGKLGGISLSECSAATLRRAAKVCKVEMVEVEFSLFATQILENGVGAACGELGIPIVAYSPIGKGFLTGQIRKPEDIPEGDFRRTASRFQGENFENNMKLVHEVEKIAAAKGCTPGQLAIAWVKQMGGRRGLPKVIIPIPGASTEARVLENCKLVELTEDEIAELDAVIDRIVIKGGRYGGPVAELEFL